MRKIIKIFKYMWRFITQEPKERADEEWEEYFAITDPLRRSGELSERRNRKYRGAHIFQHTETRVNGNTENNLD